jgi:dihydroxyacetone kinase-like protein
MGVTAQLICRAIEKCTASSETDIGKLLMTCGMEINRGSPSTFGTLLASAFVEAGKTLVGRTEVKIVDIPALGRSAVDGINRRGKSKIGEKTMLDCIVPAVESLERALSGSVNHITAIQCAIEAAKEGAKNTANMAAIHGRASYRQDHGVGVKDPGAVAISYMIQSSGIALIDLIVRKPSTMK